MDLRDVCDIEPPTHISSVIRNHIRFTSQATVTTSEQLLQHFVAFLDASHNKTGKNFQRILFFRTLLVQEAFSSSNLCLDSGVSK